MTRCVDGVESNALDLNLFAVRHSHRHDIDAALLAHHGDAAGTITKLPKPGQMIRMHVRVDSFDEPQLKFVEELDVTVDPFQHRVDDQSLAAFAACNQVCVGRRRRVEKLTEDHDNPPWS